MKVPTYSSHFSNPEMFIKQTKTGAEESEKIRSTHSKADNSQRSKISSSKEDGDLSRGKKNKRFNACIIHASDRFTNPNYFCDIN